MMGFGAFRLELQGRRQARDRVVVTALLHADVGEDHLRVGVIGQLLEDRGRLVVTLLSCQRESEVVMDDRVAIGKPLRFPGPSFRFAKLDRPPKSRLRLAKSAATELDLSHHIENHERRVRLLAQGLIQLDLGLSGSPWNQ